MIATLFLVGIGLILALGGVILLDRQRFNNRGRMEYRLASIVGVLMIVGAFI